MTITGYDKIAQEYYSDAHVTSRNFDSATRTALKDNPFKVPSGLVLEIGAGRGRGNEFLNLEPDRIVQLDNSEAMLRLENREKCLLQVHADACSIPLISRQFTAVVGFLVDAFIGLECLSEAYRMLTKGGQLLLTVPTKEWGSTLRNQLSIDPMTTRFTLLNTKEILIVPSLLHEKKRLGEMLALSGFQEICIQEHCLPRDVDPISQDISEVCKTLGRDLHSFPIIHTIRAER